MLGPEKHREAIERCRRRWIIERLRTFGSMARVDARPSADMDLLVRFAQQSESSLADPASMKLEFEPILGRRVDLVEERTTVNPHRRPRVERDLRLLYSA